jgi:hypothetical protein
MLSFMRGELAKTLGLLAITMAGSVSSSYAGAITIPAGLTPGSQYRLVFVTADTYAATATNIATYNTEVNSEANAVAVLAALHTTWLDIGSTATVNAITNIGQDPSIPIYNLDGQLVANDARTNAGGLFSGTLFHAIDYNESGTLDNTYVWTGTGTNGTGISGDQLGSRNVAEGYSADTTGGLWFHNGVTSACDGKEALYAISVVLTVPGHNPEPSTTALVLLGGAGLLFVARRRRVSRLSV